jgi:hypothetical protein
MKPVEWQTYRTRFLVKAKQLSSALSFTDHLGRQHCGRKGDYLVESTDGVLSIAPRQIFEDIYVPMPCMTPQVAEANAPQGDLDSIAAEISYLKSLPVEPLEIERIEKAEFRSCPSISRHMELENPTRARRKAPQPLRAARTTSQLSLM